MRKLFDTLSAAILGGLISTAPACAAVGSPDKPSDLCKSHVVASLEATLMNPVGMRPQKEAALKELPKCGGDAVPVLLRFGQSVRTDSSWDGMVVDAMSQVLDRRLLTPLIAMTQAGHEPPVRASALQALTAFAARSVIPIQGPPRQAPEGTKQFIGFLPFELDSNDPVRYSGQRLTYKDRKTVHSLADTLLHGYPQPLTLQQAARQSAKRLDALEAETRRILDGSEWTEQM